MKPPRSIRQVTDDERAARNAGLRSSDAVTVRRCQSLLASAERHQPSEPQDRLQRLEAELREQVQAWRLHPVVQAIQAMRGVQCTVAVTLIAERGDLTRFDTPDSS
jgi:transposase